ncbi:MAG TPA: hypothetical protein PLW65_06160 [Pseudomonadota bacterium]|nr:hypothetical protein [Pseudomonadota bacterium]
MATRSVLLPVLIAVLLGLAERPARAIALDDGCINDPVCRQHYDTALELFQDGRYEAALGEFQAAYAQRQMPWLLVNIGRTLHRLGRLKEAIAHYERYQQSGLGTDPETSQKAREYLAQARLLLAQAPKAAGSADTTTAGQPESVPLYKKWWFWTAIGGGVAAFAIVGIGLGVGLKSEPGSPPPPVPMPSTLPAGVVVYRPSF